MEYPVISEVERVRMLQYPAARADIVIDSDTANEVDDQFAIAYALLSPERLRVRAIQAAPYVIDDGLQDPAVGMERSYQEILRVLHLMGRSAPEGFVLRGSPRFMAADKRPVESPAMRGLIALAGEYTPERPLYAVCIGAITNVASAIQACPDIIRRMVVVWLGGDGFGETPDEFNVNRDKYAAQVIFDCGVPLVHVPCYPVSSHLVTSVPALKEAIGGKNPLCDFLIENVREFRPGAFASGKEIWDVAALAWLMAPDWTSSEIVAAPRITDNLTWSFDYRRPLMRNIRALRREKIFPDLFGKLSAL